MKKILALILLFTLFSIPAFAADYYIAQTAGVHIQHLLLNQAQSRRIARLKAHFRRYSFGQGRSNVGQ